MVDTATGVHMPYATTTPQEQFSALLDGELLGDAQHAAVEALLADPQAQDLWHLHHLVGDVLRSEELARSAPGDLQFLAKLERRLSEEPAPFTAVGASPTVVMPASALRRPSANAAIFRWPAVAGTAFALALAVLLGSLYLPAFTEPAGQQMAVAPLPSVEVSALNATTAVSPDGMIRDPRLDQLLSAHQQLGGHSALQMSSGFLRNATYDGKGR
ncbi:MAG: anti-anti-sigma factor [Burkholderiales bacterium PBB4]|nr:MAG: anti-anti-sigma factor [Burkholderiales bacterium PBB4]